MKMLAKKKIQDCLLIMSGKIERVYYDENPYLLEINVGDKGYSWEIHPAYRGALATGASDNWQNTLRIDEDN